MANILDVLANLESIDLRNEVPRIIEKHAESMLDYNKDQLEHGSTSENKGITPKYSLSSYAEYKNNISKSPGYGTPDLKLTGEFYAGFIVYFSGENFTIGSKDSKSNDLTQKYSSNGGIFGLTDDSLYSLTTHEIKPSIVAHIEKKTGLKLS